MTIPLGYGQITHYFAGNNCPTGAAVVYGVKLNDVALTPVTAAQAAQDAFETNILAALTNDVTLVSTYCKFGPDETGAFGGVASGEVGGLNLNSLAPNTALLVTKETALGGRRGRGRMFLPGVAETEADDAGFLTGTWPADWTAGLAAFLGDLAAADVPMYLLHGPKTEWVLDDGQPKRVPVAGAVPAPTAVVDLAISTKIATQRRRLRR